MNYLKFVILILLLVGSESFAQLFLEKASLKFKENYYLIYGMLLYLLVGFIYYIALNSNIPLAIVNIIWQTTTIFVITLISIFYFKQKISKKQIIGIIILLIGSLFLIPNTEKLVVNNNFSKDRLVNPKLKD